MAVTIYDRIDAQALLQTDVAAQPDLKIGVYFVDAEEIPVDQRIYAVTKSDFAENLDSSGYPYTVASIYFSQKRTGSSFQIARWCQSASNPYWYAGGDLETNLGTWTAISDGEVTFTAVGASATDTLTGLDFSTVTAVNQIPAVFNAALALLTPNITGLDSAVCSYDISGRLIFTMPGTGASAVNVALSAASGSGTNISTLLDVANGVSVAGVDAETIADAIDAIRAVNDTGTFYTAKFTTSSDAERAAEILTFAAKIESLRKFGVVTADDTDIKNSGVTDDIFSQLQSLGYNRTLGIYFENISDRSFILPEVALLGAVIPADEGTVDFAYEDLVGISGSGYLRALTKAETDVIAGAAGAKGKGGCVIEQVAGFTYLYKSLTFGGEELRIMVGRDWWTDLIAYNWMSYKMQTPLSGFDNETLVAAEAILIDARDQGVDRKILVDTALRPFILDMPDADDFTQAERASRWLQLTDVYSGYLNSTATDTKITGTWII